MQKAFLSLLFAAALPGLSTAGECRPWRLPNGIWLQSCAEDTWVKAGYDYEFIGPGILYKNPNGAPSLYYDPVRWIPSRDDMRLADAGGSVGIGDVAASRCGRDRMPFDGTYGDEGRCGCRARQMRPQKDRLCQCIQPPLPSHEKL